MANQERPKELVFVRHGESEANIVHQDAKNGDTSGYSDEFRDKPDSEMALTDRGIDQAIAAGEWIRANINNGYFAAYYVSPLRRAQHTAGHLHLPEAEITGVWRTRSYLRELSYGYASGIPRDELNTIFPEIMSSKKRDGVYWQRPGGESMVEIADRAKLGIIATLYREVPEASAIAVTHGHFLWGVRMILESLTFEVYEQLHNSPDPLDEIHNCQVLHYTRIDPDDPNHLADNFTWMRSICPWDQSLSNNEWQKIERIKFTNKQLLAR